MLLCCVLYMNIDIKVQSQNVSGHSGNWKEAWYLLILATKLSNTAWPVNLDHSLTE